MLAVLGVGWKSADVTVSEGVGQRDPDKSRIKSCETQNPKRNFECCTVTMQILLPTCIHYVSHKYSVPLNLFTFSVEKSLQSGCKMGICITVVLESL